MSTFNAGAIEAKLTLGRSDWTRDLRKTQKEIQDLERKSITIGVDLDTDNARVAMDNLELFLEDFDGQTYAPSVDLVTRDAEQALRELEERLDALDRRNVTVAIDADATNAEIAIDNLKHDLDALDMEDVVIGIDVDSAKAQTELIELSLQMQRMGMDDIDIGVDVNGYAKAITQLNILEAQVDMLDGRDIDLDVDIDRNALTDLVGAPGGDGSGGHLGLLRILIYSLLALSPILAASMGALTAAIIAFGAAVAGAAGPVLVLAAGLAGLTARFKAAKDAGEELSAPMQAFADAIDAVKEAWNEFLDNIEVAGFELMANALDLVAQILPTLAPLFNATAEAMSGIVDGIRSFVDSPEYQEMLDFFMGFGVDMLESFMRILGNLIRFFGRLFQAIEPFAREMMQGLEDVTRGWMEWADDLENNDSFQTFVDNALEYGPRILDMLGSLIQAFMAIGRALEPFAGPMLDGLTALFDLIANAPTEVLTALIALAAGLWLGFNVLAPAIGAVSAGLTALTTALGIGLGPLVLIAGAVVALGIAIHQLWKENETFKKAVLKTWDAIESAITPIIEDITDAIREYWGPIKAWADDLWNSIKDIIVDAMVIIQQVIRGASAVITYIWNAMGDDLIDRVASFIGNIGQAIKGFVTFIGGLFKLIKSVLTGDWKGIWEALKMIWNGFWGFIRGALGAFKDMAIAPFEALKNILGRLWGDTMGKLRSLWTDFRNWINGKWDSFVAKFRGFKMPGFSDMWKGIKDSWNAVKDWIDGKWQSFKDKFSGFKLTGVGDMFDGISGAFRGALRQIQDWWNGLSFTLDVPDILPGPDSYTISTPDFHLFEKGGYVTDPVFGLIGEGKDNEIIAPEPVMERIVKENSGTEIDYARMGAAVAAALASILVNLRGVTPEDLERLIEAASVNVAIDARSEGDSAAKLAKAIGFELRLLGYGGKAA